jgi:hypothetical protein
MSWDAGVEIIAPAHASTSFSQALRVFLTTNGESVFSTVYEVDDLDAAVTRAMAQEATIVFEETIEPDVLAARLRWPLERRVRVRQALLSELSGVVVCLQESHAL